MDTNKSDYNLTTYTIEISLYPTVNTFLIEPQLTTHTRKVKALSKLPCGYLRNSTLFTNIYPVSLEKL